jgi:hypothetical protein
MKLHARESGQVLPILAMLVVVLIGLLGLAIDVGRLYVAKAELSRSLDAAALAGVLELPDQGAAQSRAAAYLSKNLPGATASYPESSSQSVFKVNGTRNVPLVFMRVFGFDAMDVKAGAAAGFGGVPLDAALILDGTSSMGDSPCNGAQSNAGCPIKEAKDAATGFVNTLLTGKDSMTQVGYAPYRGCYNPPRQYASCVPSSMVVDLDDDAAVLQTGITNTKAEGGTGTNICLGLYQAQSMLFGPNAQEGENVIRAAVILTDGDNNYNSVTYGNGSPPTDCRPNTNPSGSDPSGTCRPAQTRERELDAKTLALANALKAQGVDIYVVAFGVCAVDNTSKPSDPGYCNGVGNSDHDNAADRRLLKCVASSTDGTNDHYFEVGSASDLPDVFAKIARKLAFRLTE